jgi:hypothetical protein
MDYKLLDCNSLGNSFRGGGRKGYIITRILITVHVPQFPTANISLDWIP